MGRRVKEAAADGSALVGERGAAREVAMRALRRVGEYFAVGVGVYAMAHVLLMLGQAMWLPPERRQIMQAMVTGLGMLVYGAAKLAGRVWRRWSTGGAKKPDAEGEEPVGRVLMVHGVPVAAALACMVGAFFVFLEFTRLNRMCVKQFQPPAGWWEQQFGEQGEGAADTGHAAGGAGGGHGGESAVASGLDEKIPPFLDRRHSSIYVPLESIPEWRSFLAGRGRGDPDRGLEDYLTNDPMSVVSWLQSSAGVAALAQTSMRLTWTHLLLVSLLAAAAGATFSPAEAVVDRIAHMLA